MPVIRDAGSVTNSSRLGMVERPGDWLIATDVAHPVSDVAVMPTRADTAQYFVLWLLLAAVVPIPLFAALSQLRDTDLAVEITYHTLFLLSVAHGGLTGMFWLDKRFCQG